MHKKLIKKLLGIHPPYLSIAEQIMCNLYNLPRASWVDRGVENPETVGQHTIALVRLSNKYFLIDGLDSMLLVHDWAENNIGDQRTDKYCPEAKRLSKEVKYDLELQALQSITLKLGDRGKYVLDLWIEFEAQETLRSRLAYQLDKFQMISQAFKYQKQGQPVVAQEFLDSDGDKIQNFILRHALEKLKTRS